MVSESVSYLQKAITQIESDRDLQSPGVRIAPIVTVTTGLLEAGVSTEEPLLQSSLRFLQRFNDDQTSSACHATVPDDLLTKIKNCLDKARQNPDAFALNAQPQSFDTRDSLDRLLETLDSLDDSDAVSRAKEFVRTLNGDDHSDSVTGTFDVVMTTETRYVVSRGWSRSVRIHDFGRTLVEPETLPNGNGFSTAEFDSLIAAVHGQQDFPSLPHGRRFPKRESLLVAFSTIPRLNDKRKKTTDEPVPTGLAETYRSWYAAFEPQQSVLRRHLPADNLVALQTVRRLE